MQELEKRTLDFAIAVRDFCKKLKFDTINVVYIKQLIRSSSSIGANYIEANENLGKADLKMRIKISRKEAKETIYWLNLILSEESVSTQKEKLKDEAEQLRKILSSILMKVQ
jgi:four helix bundle protein